MTGASVLQEVRQMRFEELDIRRQRRELTMAEAAELWTKNRLHAADYVTRARRRGAHRKKRPRKPLPGMMLHQAGSRHEWVPGCRCDLIVTMDDATNERCSAFFVEGEGTMSSFPGLREVIEAKGLFRSLYPIGDARLVHRAGWGGGGQEPPDAGASRVDDVLHTPDNLTCYRQGTSCAIYKHYCLDGLWHLVAALDPLSLDHSRKRSRPGHFSYIDP